MAVEMALVVQPGSGVPIYRQVAEQVRAGVVGGRLREGEMLPSVREVAERLQVNPMTISKAYSMLEREGVVELVRGTGMRVRGVEGNGRAKAEVLLPLLKQVAGTARQLGMSSEQVVKLVRNVMEEGR